MTFQMIKCRKILSENGEGLGLVQTLVEDIERAVSQNSNAVFCLCYSLIDTTCKTILDKYDVEDTSDKLPHRVTRTLRLLNLFPPEYETENQKDDGIPRILSGLATTVLGLCNLRNKDGVYSHGKIATHEPYDLLQLQLAMDTTDTVVHYMLQAYLDYPPPVSEINYEDHTDFNDSIDDSHGIVEISGQVFLPSKILFLADSEHTTYREMLEEYRQQLELEAEDVAEYRA